MTTEYVARWKPPPPEAEPKPRALHLYAGPSKEQKIADIDRGFDDGYAAAGKDTEGRDTSQGTHYEIGYAHGLAVGLKHIEYAETSRHPSAQTPEKK